MEEDDRPLDLIERLAGKGSPHRQVRIVLEASGKIGLLASVKPQRRVMDREGQKLVLSLIHETLPEQFDICPGLTVRPTIHIELALPMTIEQFEAYQKWVDSVALPAEPLAPCTST